MRANPIDPRREPRFRPAAVAVPIALAVAAALALSGCGRPAPTDALDDFAGDPEIAGVSVTSPDAVVSTVPGPPADDTTTTTAAPLPEQILYTVQPGDTLSGIATSYGITVEQLAEYNGITDVHALRLGQELAIPPQTVPQADAPTGSEPSAAPDDSTGAAGTSETTLDQ